MDTYGFQGKMTNCQDYAYGDGGVPEADFLPRAIELPQPMAAGTPYSVSLEAISPIPQAEFWGSDAECGFGRQLLWSGDVERGIFCVEMAPSASYTHIVMVWRGPGGTHGDVGLCPGAACPP